MTVQQLSRGNEITRELDKLHEQINEKVKLFDVLDQKQENRDENVWLNVWGTGAHFTVGTIKDFIQSEIKKHREQIKALEAEFVNL